MRYFEIASGLRLPVNTEEQELLDADELKFSDMDERQQEIARLMVSRGLLRQFIKDKEIYYKPKSDKDIWRNRDG